MIRLELPNFPSPKTQRGTMTNDGQIISMVFDQASITSAASDNTSCPISQQLELKIHCVGSGGALVRLEIYGARANLGQHSWNHAFILVNGKRLPLQAAVGSDTSVDERWYTALTVPVKSRQWLHISVSLLAQRDLSDNSSIAQIGLDTIDLEIIKQIP